MACAQGGEQGRGVDLGMAFAAVVPFLWTAQGSSVMCCCCSGTASGNRASMRLR